jgi:hypothetical protein
VSAPDGAWATTYQEATAVNQSSPPPCGGTSGLTDADRRLIAKARELAALRTTAAICDRFPGWDDTAAAYAEAFGTARWLLDELAGIAERAGEPQ